MADDKSPERKFMRIRKDLYHQNAEPFSILNGGMGTTVGNSPLEGPSQRIVSWDQDQKTMQSVIHQPYPMPTIGNNYAGNSTAIYNGDQLSGNILLAPTGNGPYAAAVPALPGRYMPAIGVRPSANQQLPQGYAAAPLYQNENLSKAPDEVLTNQQQSGENSATAESAVPTPNMPPSSSEQYPKHQKWPQAIAAGSPSQNMDSLIVKHEAPEIKHELDLEQFIDQCMAGNAQSNMGVDQDQTQTKSNPITSKDKNRMSPDEGYPSVSSEHYQQWPQSSSPHDKPMVEHEVLDTTHELDACQLIEQYVAKISQSNIEVPMVKHEPQEIKYELDVEQLIEQCREAENFQPKLEVPMMKHEPQEIKNELDVEQLIKQCREAENLQPKQEVDQEQTQTKSNLIMHDKNQIEPPTEVLTNQQKSDVDPVASDPGYPSTSSKKTKINKLSTIEKQTQPKSYPKMRCKNRIKPPTEVLTSRQQFGKNPATAKPPVPGQSISPDVGYPSTSSVQTKNNLVRDLHLPVPEARPPTPRKQNEPTENESEGGGTRGTGGRRIYIEYSEFKCDKCGKFCSRKRGLIQHQKWVHRDLKFPCKWCGKNFLTEESLNEHIQWHNMPDKPFKCERCSKQFVHKSDLRRHEKSDPYECDICPRTFSRQDHLMRHKLSHKRRDKKRSDKAKGKRS